MTMIPVRVTRVSEVAPKIREFRLAAVGEELPPFSPGSHVMVEMNGADKTYRNAYSLLSDPFAPQHYAIAVRLQDESRGGSVFMHTRVKEGDVLHISPPANLFAPLWQAKKHILIAGGVGITPFLSYLPALQRRAADFELHYLFRSSQTGAYRNELAQQLGERLHAYDSDAGERCDVRSLLRGNLPGTHVYICGPQSLISAVKDAAAALGIPPAFIHAEEFSAPKPGKPFTVKLAASGQEIAVDAETSMLEALEQAGVAVHNMCRGGVCGQCVTRVKDGVPEHRDEFLSAAEKAGNNCVMPCVSRALSDTLVLEL